MKPEESETVSVLVAKQEESEYISEYIALATVLRGTDKPFSIAGQAETGKDAVQLIRELQPDVALIDACFADMPGTEVAREVRQVSPATKLLILTRDDCIDHVLEAFDAGADGYYLPNASPEEISAAVRAVNAGACCIAPSIMHAMLEVCKAAKAPAPVTPVSSETNFFGLTMRELQVLGLIVEGFSNREIAKQLRLRETTVKSHVRSILGRLSVTRRTEAAVKAVDSGAVVYRGL